MVPSSELQETGPTPRHPDPPSHAESERQRARWIVGLKRVENMLSQLTAATSTFKDAEIDIVSSLARGREASTPKNWEKL